MRQFNFEELDNPRQFRVVPSLEFNGLFEIRDQQNKKLKDEMYRDKNRAKEILGSYLTTRSEAKKKPQAKKVK